VSIIDTVKYEMSGKTLIQIPKTQSIDAVKALLAYVGRASNPLPTDVSLEDGRLVLVLSKKRDAYYCVTSRQCSCPSSAYRPGLPCKHMRKFFPVEATNKPDDCGSIRPKVGSFKPFSLLPSEERRAAGVGAV